MAAGWIVPVAKEGFKHREELLSFWEKISAKLLGAKSEIVITGMAGAGKSVLLEHLTGQAYERSRPLPLQPSPAAERGKVLAPGQQIRLMTIPGQEIAARFEAEVQAFVSKKTITGVIHVVANGFETTRVATARRALIEAGLTTIQQYREQMLEREVEDLRRTCGFLKQCIMRHHKPVWMLVVASKCDLFTSELAQAEDYYSPAAKNPFVSELSALSQAVGSLQFSWSAMPACGSLEDFEWNGETAPSTLKSPQRDALISDVLRRVEASCEKS